MEPDIFVLGSRSEKRTPPVGLEPTTLRLTAECSTIELSRIIPSAFAETVILFDYTLKTTH